MTEEAAGAATAGEFPDVALLFRGLSAVVFDFDGVLVDSVGLKSEAFAALYPEESEVFRAAVVAYHLEHGGLSRAHKIAHFEEMRIGGPPSAERVHELVDRFAHLVTERVIAAPEMDCVEQLLGHLSFRMPLFVCSATPQAELRHIVRVRGWHHYFTGVFGSPDEKHTILSQIAATLRCENANVLMIGDAQSDQESASRAGTGFLRFNEKSEVLSGGPPEIRSFCTVVRVLTWVDPGGQFPDIT